MAAAQGLLLVSGASDIFLYPVPSSERLESHSWFPFHYNRWERSEFRIHADLEVKAVFHELLCATMKEGPAGTLPVDEVALADAGRVSLETWRRLAAREWPPLYGWQPCICDDGRRRLYHKTVMENVLEALKGRNKWKESAEAERERKRIAALPDKILRAGGSQRLSEDKAYVTRLDQFLLDHLPEGKSRTPKMVLKAMEAIELGQTGPL